jgi:hypothetical protein
MTFFVCRSQKQSLEHVIARNFSSEAISGIRKVQMLYLFNAGDCHAAAPLAMTGRKFAGDCRGRKRPRNDIFCVALAILAALVAFAHYVRSAEDKLKYKKALYRYSAF